MASVRKRKTKDGTKYTVLYDFIDSEGNRKQRSAGSFASKKDADALKLEIELKKSKNTFIVPHTTTVEQFITQWLPVRAKAKKWEYSYLTMVTGLLENHVIPEIGDLNMQQIGPQHIEMMFATLQSKRCQGPKSFGKSSDEIPYLSGSTLASIYTVLKCMFEAAVAWKQIPENPVTMDKPQRDEPQIDDIVFWDLPQILTALDSIEDPLLRLMVHIASAHTCRNGEICGITLDAVDWEKGALKIDKTIQRISKKAFASLPQKEVFQIFPDKTESSRSMVVLKTPKTKGSIRWICLTKPILKELRRRKELIAKNKLYFGDEYNDYNLLFCQPNGDPITPHLLEKWFRLWQQRHNDLHLPFIEFHGLRHSAATLLMFLSNSDAKTVQSITGHSSAKLVFDTYNHVLMDRQQLLVQKLERAMYGSEPQTVSDAKELASDDILLMIRKNPLLQQEVFSALFAEVAQNAQDLAR